MKVFAAWSSSEQESYHRLSVICGSTVKSFRWRCADLTGTLVKASP